MNLPRRDFLKTTLAASAAATLASPLAAAATSATSGREFYDLRVYRLKPDAPRALLDGYLEKSFLPALERRGIKNVGVFTELEVKKDTATSTPRANSPIWVLVPHGSLESFVSVSAEINQDPEVRTSASDYLQTPKTAAAFDRVDAWLLLAFKSMPRIEVPEFSRRRVPTRIFELRTYESYSEEKALRKMAMFDDGETEIMRKVGMSPVFFGQALAGSNLPHLTYITSGPDLATHLDNWKKFGVHPDWVKMRGDPKYADTVSKNSPFFLAPTAYSQI